MRAMRRACCWCSRSASSLQPHIATGDIALGETLVIEVQRTPGVNLVDLLHG